MNKTKNGLKPMRGKNLPPPVDPQCSSEQRLAAALKKQKDFNQDMEDEEYVLLYPDGSQIKNIPGTDTPFTIGEYKEAIGKACQRITLYICTLEDLLSKNFEGVEILPEKDRRSSFDPTCSMMVKFTDDAGLTEEALDSGGPTREFLTLLMDSIKTRRVYESKDNAKYLSFDSKEDNEYFHIGRMIAVSIVHGSPGPCCLSPNFFLYLIGKVKTLEAPIEDIPDDEVKRGLLETLEDIKKVVDDYIQWYFIYRNHVSIQRFKEGLATLDFVNALEQHPSLFFSFMCYTETKLMLWRTSSMCMPKKKRMATIKLIRLYQ
ncbi:G2/M phase-specific E3 ubiquitin-protein ligase [Labeo rohita]|uniref:G2/M phase-specific E3 ubiquitin-protein ligase n=1 Tax=Labeo rohita TaxID=84645 RepID=A0ABQ8L5P3_LABRO|nr:G2/M phase-specific E3 ubiquitin-protein ligase [Labeo rohita]